ncbi:MAG: efflux RND transporter periplasmic adaptor subunit [Caulobacteraceae bacterium]|nr:efflux RND transporter periplasmic adaptor subunit [Caulobacteraceae bacterium]
MLKPVRPERRVAPRLLVAWAAATAVAACGRPQAPPPSGPPPVGVLVLQSQPVTLATELPGRTSPTLTSDVRPQVGGVIKQRLFVEGAVVRAGQALYQIDPAPYQAALDQAKGQLAGAQANVTTARLKAERYADLVKINAVSRQDNDDAQAAYQQDLAAVAQAKAAVEQARINLGYTRVAAPISGRIGRALVTPGALVSADQSTALATIQQLDPIYVDLAQSSDELLALKRQLAGGALSKAGRATAEASLTLSDGEAYPQRGQIKVSEVTVDPSTGSVTLRAQFPNPDGLLLPGMFVRARIGEGVYPAVILAPQTAVAHDPKGEATALVVGPGDKAQLRRLTIAGAQGGQWVVTGGLSAGDRLIVEGQSKVQEGMAVKPYAAGASETATPGAAAPGAAPSGG